ncbi:M23 family metallopeptidase [Novosphingobium sp. JCM 18896]|uniref:M23 family metallopeptidase n=1 Tax=Novosphingobium sp. JCM 18896 TaxID=2989731 RepID=UPI0022222ADD|nr:M23 family metallopeptidase [Novosphingobium sp. JCM 18896]MCW1429309.1 M23 family metallopeptidase [Novosphingobium sp. JCM 18896]
MSASGVMDRLRTLFPEREFFMRSQGQVRFIKISSKLQMAAAGVVAALLLAWVVTMATVAISQILSTHDRMALLNREAKVTTAESRVAEYRNDLKAVAADLNRRQDFIDKMADSQFGVLPSDPQAGETVSDSRGEAGRTVDKVSAALPEATGLARIEARQLAFVERLTRMADRRALRAADAIRTLGLNPEQMITQLNDRSAQGGPLLHLATSADGTIDPRFQRMGMSLARMNLLERGLAGIPQVEPADMDYVSSGFGYRADPFTGEGAFHAGLDFKGPIGAPVHAAAKGVVSFVGQKQGYGNCLEIDHGNGLLTRYAHLSAFHARVGQPVKAGDFVAQIGSSGRSTGPHLHFEVRINDRPVNPRPFLEAAPHVLEEARVGRPGLRK